MPLTPEDILQAYGLIAKGSTGEGTLDAFLNSFPANKEGLGGGAVIDDLTDLDQNPAYRISAHNWVDTLKKQKKLQDLPAALETLMRFMVGK